MIGGVIVAFAFCLLLLLRFTSDSGKSFPMKSLPAPFTNELDQARALLQTFGERTSLEARATLVRHPDITLQRMRQFPDEASRAFFRPSEFSDNAFEYQIDGIDFLEIEVQVGQRRRIAIFEKAREGLLLDWESFVSYSEAPWLTFLEAGNAGPTDFRVFISVDNYYNFQYEDASRFACFRLEDPARSRHCWGFAERDSPVHRRLEALVDRETGEEKEVHPVTSEPRIALDPIRETVAILSLVFEPHLTPDNNCRGLVWIESVVSDGWVIP